MKVIAVNGRMVLVHDGAKGYFANKREILAEVDLEESPQMLDAVQLKWGYVPLKEAIEIRDLDDVDTGIIDEARSRMAWEKDYVS